MRRIVYYVAVSLDGYIAGTNGSVEGFLLSGQGVDKYLSDLLNFDTVIMGRNTYEFGYQFGLQPGQPAYAHMKHYIFSEHLHFENPHPNVYVKKAVIEEVEHIQKQEGTDIYLCGGGQLAGWLLDYQKIEILKIKLNPLLMGKGIRLFGLSETKYKLQLIDSNTYEDGLQIITYQVQYQTA